MANETFPYKINNLNENVHKRLQNHFKGHLNGFVEVGSEKWIFPREYTELGPIYYNFHVRPDDIWIVTFPRSGTTLTQEMIWLIDNNYDFDTAKNETLIKRFPFLETNLCVNGEILDKCMKNAKDEKIKKFLMETHLQVWKVISEMRQKRYIKTHLPIPVLPKTLISSGCKVIYVARNPKDVLISNYHFNRRLKSIDYNGTFEEYWKYFKNNLTTYSPYFQHIKEGWQCKNEKNVLFLFYEDINNNRDETIKTIANFLGKPSPTKSQIKMLKEHLSIDNFKTNQAISQFENFIKSGLVHINTESFIRKGISGGWINELPEEINREMDKWIEENLQDTDLRFSF